MNDLSSQQKKIAQLIQGSDVLTGEVGRQLDILSSNTVINAIETFSDEIQIEQDKFVAPINVYVTLNYGRADERIEWAECFPGEIRGSLVNGDLKLDTTHIDTRSFTGKIAGA